MAGRQPWVGPRPDLRSGVALAGVTPEALAGEKREALGEKPEVRAAVPAVQAGKPRPVQPSRALPSPLRAA